MGFGRKVGAFLGLVPEDGHTGQRDGYDPAYPADYRSDQYDDFDGAEYSGEYGRDYGSEHAGVAAGRGVDHADGGYAAADRSGDRYSARMDSRFDGVRSDSVRSDGGRPESGFDAPMTQGATALQPLVAPRREPEIKTAGRPVTIKLTGFSEARVIGEKYRDGQSVIMDMTEMADADARRLVDFAAGLAFAMRGSIDKVTTKVFMLLPSDIDAADISAEQRREFAGAGSR